MKAPYVPQVDALRAIAVIAVMVFHLDSLWLPGGFAGVDVFFVVSGYVISRSMMELDSSSYPRFAAEFYSKRMLRIVPALLACLIVTVAFTVVFVPLAWLSSQADETALYALWGAANYALLGRDDGYFTPRIEYNPTAHMWSLGVEQQFYLLFPFIFLVWLACRRRQAVVRHTGAILLGALFLASLSFCAYATQHEAGKAYYLLPSRFWELAAGALLFQLHAINKRLMRGGSGQVAVALALIVTGLLRRSRRHFRFPGRSLPSSARRWSSMPSLAPVSRNRH